MGRAGADTSVLPIGSTLNWIERRLTRVNLRYTLELDYHSVSHCHESDEFFRCDPYCKCSTIEDAEVKEANPAEIAWALCNPGSPLADPTSKDKTGATPFEAYAIERALVREKVFDVIDSEDWHIAPTWGYYGEEIGTVSMTDPKAKEIASLLTPLLELPIGERLAKMIEEERGFEHSYLRDLDWSVERVLLKKIPFVPVEKPLERYSYYPNYGIPIAVTVGTESGFSLVDGRERLSAALLYRDRYQKPKPGKRASPFKVPVLVGRFPKST